MRDSAPSPLAAPAGALRRRALLAGGGAWLALPAAAALRPPAADAATLPAALRDMLGGAGLPLSSFGLQVQAVAAKQPPLVSLNAEQPYQLASTTKLVTSMAALDLLGAQYRWQTYAFLTGPLHQGKLLGDLLIVGGGNALLRSDDLRAWLALMRTQGLNEVLGDIVLDRYAFRLQLDDFSQTPQPAVDRPHHAWPDALTLDEGRLRVQVGGGPEGRAQLRLQPPLAGVRLDNRLEQRAAGGGCTLWAQWQAPPDGSFALPAVSVRGRWAPDCGPLEVQLAPLSHDEFTTRAVQGMWREVGGRLRGRVIDKAQPDRTGLLPSDAQGVPVLPWLVHRSEPLPQLLRDINKTSDNLAARNLMLSLARGFPLRAATLAAARDRLAGWLLQQGLAPGDIAVDNGSGLSRAERGKPRALVQLLRQSWAGRQGQALVNSLPVAGVDGTLAHRMTQGQATGRAFLKTGTLLDTRALAGYVQAASGKTYAVAALVNHPEAVRALPALDKLIEWVAVKG